MTSTRIDLQLQLPLAREVCKHPETNDNIVTIFIEYIRIDVAPVSLNWKVKNNILLCKSHKNQWQVFGVLKFCTFQCEYRRKLEFKHFPFVPVYRAYCLYCIIHMLFARWSLLIALQGILLSMRKVFDI